MANVCSQCGAPVENGIKFCKYCGAEIENAVIAEKQTQQNIVTNQAPPVTNQVSYSNMQAQQKKVPVKNKVTAGLLALFLGGLGIHKFYLGKIGQGILYLVFCWTCIPAFIALIEGIIYLTKSDEEWAEKVGYRIVQ